MGLKCVETRFIKGFYDGPNTKVQFDSGESYSFISKSRIKDLGLEKPKKTSFSVVIPSGETFHCNMLFYKLLVRIGKIKFLSDLFSLAMGNLDVILGMDWFGKYKVVIDCEEQTVTLSGHRGERVKHRKFPKGPKTKIMSSLVMNKFIKQGHPWFLCSVSKVDNREVWREDILVICDFKDIYPVWK